MLTTMTDLGEVQSFKVVTRTGGEDKTVRTQRNLTAWIDQFLWSGYCILTASTAGTVRPIILQQLAGIG